MKIINRLKKKLNKNPDVAKFQKDKSEYIKQSGKDDLFRYNSEEEFAVLHEYKETAGSVDAHYFFQDIFVASYILKKGIKHIYDIGSRVDGYISHLLAGGCSVTMIDIRPLPIKINNLDFMQGNAIDLSNITNNSIPVLTSLHALEHFGLGRYGDPVDYNGWRKALRNFAKKVQHGGTLIVSVPCGNKNVLMFNAHRIFAPITIYNEIKDMMKLESFSKIQNYNVTTFPFENEENVEKKLGEIAKTLGKYDCGIFILRKEG